MASITLPVDSTSKSGRNAIVNPNISVTAGKRYAVVIKSATTKGYYGFAYSDILTDPNNVASISNDSGASFSAEKNRVLKLNVSIK